MVRIASMFGMGGLFLTISPKLRGQLMGAIGSGVTAMDLYAPYSYIGFGFLVLVALMVSLYRGAQAR